MVNKNKASEDIEIPDYIEKTFKPGEIILKEGEKSGCAYQILEGLVEVSKQKKGAKIKLAELGKGAIFGEMSLIDNLPHSATVSAINEVRCLFIDSSVYEREINNCSLLIQDLISAFSKRLRVASDKITVLAEGEDQK